MRPAFVLVEGGKLHRNPSFEDCNVDDAAVVNRYKSLDDVPPKARKDACAKCEPLGAQPKIAKGKQHDVDDAPPPPPDVAPAPPPNDEAPSA